MHLLKGMAKMGEFDRVQEMRYHIFALDHGVTLHRITKAEKGKLFMVAHLAKTAVDRQRSSLFMGRD